MNREKQGRNSTKLAIIITVSPITSARRRDDFWIAPIFDDGFLALCPFTGMEGYFLPYSAHFWVEAGKYTICNRSITSCQFFLDTSKNDDTSL